MLKKTIIISTALFVFIAVGLAYKIHSSLEGVEMNTKNIIIHEDDEKEIKQREESRNEESVEKEKKKKKPEDFYALTIGLDYRDEIFSLNTDSIIVAHIIPQSKEIKLVSLPRDLKMVDLRDNIAKVNSVFNVGYQHALKEGRKDPSLLSGKTISMGNMHVPEEYISSGSVLLRETVEKFLDIDIKHTFIVNFQTVTSLVDEVGGIKVNVDRDMEYDDPTDDTHIHLEKGIQVLNGTNALNYARFREDNRGVDFFSNDFERGIRQQTVITALVHELSNWSNITNIFNLLDIISANFKTDMERADMVDLIKKYHKHLSGDSVISIPFEGYWESPYVHITDQKLQKLKKDFTSID